MLNSRQTPKTIQEDTASAVPSSIRMTQFPMAETTRQASMTRNPSTYLLKTNVRREMGSEKAYRYHWLASS